MLFLNIYYILIALNIEVSPFLLLYCPLRVFYCVLTNLSTIVCKCQCEGAPLYGVCLCVFLHVCVCVCVL